MKKYLFYFLSFIAIGFTSCSDNDDGSVDFTNNLNAPQNVNVIFEITQDNTGLVTLTPIGEGANSFQIDFGDGSGTETVLPGRNIKHTYDEGNFSVGLTAINLAGNRTTIQKDLSVSFKAPENFEVTIQPVPTDPFSITVSATADFETFFQVFFGDAENETPTPFNQGDVITHTYDDVGEYVVRVIALSGGAASSEFTQTVVITNPLLLPVNFESDKLDFTFIDFEGATTTVIDNPDASGSNTSAKVAQFVKGDGAQFFAGSILELDQNIDFSTLRKIKMKVWSPKSAIVVKLKLENATDPNVSAEVDVVNKTTNQWEELIFDFTGLTDGKELSKLIFFFDFENAGDGASYFFDDIEQTNDSVEPIALPLDFENANQTFTTFNGAVFSFATDPEDSNNQVGQLVNSGSQFEGMTLELDEAVDFSSEKIITLRFFTSNPNNSILLKFENGTADPVEVIQTISNSGWNTVSFDFSQAQLSFPLSGPIDATGAYNNITIFVDGPDTKAGTYFFDDITAGVINQTPINLPLTFEDTQTTFNWIGFGASDFGPIPAAIINNPDPSGINTSSRVLEIIKTAGAQVWAGASLNLSGPLNFGDGTTATVKVWSPKSGTPVLFKIEDSNSPPDGNGNPSVFVEVLATTTAANAWEELTFDLTSVTSFSTAIPYDRVILFPDFGNPGSGDTFFFDDVRLTTPGQGGGGGVSNPPSLIEDFQGVAPTFTSFGNIPTSQVVSNPNASGINTSTLVAELVKAQGSEIWAGTFIEGKVIDVASLPYIKVKVLSPKSGIVVKVKIENADASITHEVDVTNTLANQWEELSYNFSAAPAANYVRFVIFFDFGNSGDGSVYHFDDIILSTTSDGTSGGGGSGGGSGSAGTPPLNPIDFEAGGFGANWTWTVFENGTNPPVEIVANPDASGINTSAKVLKVTALQAGNPWAGFESKHGADIGSFTFDQTNKIVRIMVWKSVISDVGLKFAENNGEAQPEIKIPNTKVNEWEEITFDVSSLIGKGITGIIDQIIIFPDFDLSGRTQDNVVYIDNIRFSGQ